MDLKLKDKNVENETEDKVEVRTEEADIQTTEETTTIGMFLKYTRMKQKKSVETVSEALCIRKIYINAIESDDYETLSPVPYGIGFVRSYATYLGLNPDRIVQVYKQQSLPKNEKKVQPVTVKRSKESIPTKRLIIFCLIAIFIFYIAYLIVHTKTKKNSDILPAVEENNLIEVIPAPEDTLPQEGKVDEKQSDITAVSEENKDENQEISKGEPSQINISTGNYVEETPQNETFKTMVLKFKGESWLEVKDSDKVYISGIFQKGFEYTIPAEKGLILSVGKYFNVDMYIDDVLTKVATPQKQTGIELDPILKH